MITAKPKLTYNRPSFLVDYQLDILNDPSDLICIEGGTKSGKTATMAILALEEGLNGQPGDEVYWIAPISSQAKVGYDYINEFIHNTALELKDPTTGYGATIYLCNGVKIKFIGNGEDQSATNRIYNNRAIFAIIDEASRCHREVFDAAQSITTQTQGRICMIGNVIDKTNWFYLLCRKVDNDQIDGSYYKVTYRDAVKAGILNQGRIDKIKKQMAEYMFASLYECEPLDDFKNPFGLQHIDNCIRDYDIKTIDNVEYYGVDVGRYHDKTCIIGINNDGYVGIVDIFLNDHTLQKDRIKNVVGDHTCYMDTTGITAGDVYYDMLSPDMPGLEPYNFTASSKKELISNLALYIQTGKVFIPKKQDILINELKNYQLKISSTGSISFSNNSAKVKFDDTVIGIALSCMAHKNLCKDLPYDFFID